MIPGRTPVSTARQIEEMQTDLRRRLRPNLVRSAIWTRYVIDMTFRTYNSMDRVTWHEWLFHWFAGRIDPQRQLTEFGVRG